MASNPRRRSALVLAVLLLGCWVGYFICVNMTIKYCEVCEPAVIVHSSGNKSAPSDGDVRVQLETPGVVYDCLTWEVRYKYDADVLDKAYAVFPEILDGAEGDAQRQKSFVEIYHKQLWMETQDRLVDQSDKSYKASGPGATLEAAQGVLAVLHTMVDKLKQGLNKPKIKILDMPCGDLQWMTYFLNTRSDIDYTGMDIVPELIEKHKRMYADKSNIHFEHFDIVKSKLDHSYDFIICRMMLQHLLNADVLKALSHFSSSNSVYIGATTFPEVEKNEELIPLGGRLRFLNLEKAPVNLSPPICTFPEPLFPNHHFAIWKLPLFQRIS